MGDEGAWVGVMREGGLTREGGQRLDRILAAGTRLLADHGIETPAREARLLLAHALGLSAEALLRLDRAHIVPAAAFIDLVDRRAVARTPLAHLVGTRGFWTLDLAVSPATLIPRADSETLIEAALQACPDRAAIRRILDLGTGTGALLLACLAEFPAAFAIGTDLVEAACHLARANAYRAGLSARCSIVRGSWAAAIDPRHVGGFDLILSNPPYIPSAEIDTLMPEIARHEPRSALDGGADGLDAYRVLLPALSTLLGPDGIAIVEIGQGQAPDLAAIASASGLVVMRARADLGGIARALTLVRPSHPGLGSSRS